MNRNPWLFAAPVALALASFGTAAAQTGGATATVDVKAGSAVSSGDQATLADQYVVKMQGSSTRIRHLLDDARRQKDVVKTTCLSDKLAQVEVAIRSAKERVGALKSAIARGDTDLRNHEFSVMSVLRQRTEQLDAEANQCIGEELGFPGETKITFSIDPNIATIEPTGGGGILSASPPALPASGFM